MAVYDLEEQEQMDDLKAWWSRWGNTVATVLVVASLAVVAVQGWRCWQFRKAEDAAVLFNAVVQAARANDVTKAKDASAALADKFAGIGYAPRAAFLVAKMQFDAGDTGAARAQLQWVVDRADEQELKEIARYRLAELMLNDKQYDEALKMLDAKHSEPFSGLYADLRGDAHAAAGRADDARAAYKEALAKIDGKSQYRNYVQVKLDSLGAAAPDAAAMTPAAASPAAASPAAASPAVASPAVASPAAAPPAAAPAPATPTPAPKQ
jgi:predicted negative regulator of RcsB-dependent stress response